MKFLLSLAILSLVAAGCASAPRTPSSAHVYKILAADSSEGVKISKTTDGGSATFEYCTGMAFGAGSCDKLGIVDKSNVDLFQQRFKAQLDSRSSKDVGRAGLCGITLGLSLLVTQNPFSDDHDDGNWKHLESCSIDAVTRDEDGNYVTKVSPKALRAFYEQIFK